MATVLYSDQEWRLLFISDGEMGMYINPPAGVELHAGDRAQIEGATAPFDKGLDNARVVAIGKGDPLPSPLMVRSPSELKDLLSQWVAINGRIRWEGSQNGRRELQLWAKGQRCSVLFRQAEAQELPPVGSDVTVTGVSAANFDAAGHLSGARILSPSPRYLHVVRFGPPSLFSLPQTPPAALSHLPAGSLAHLTGSVTSATNRASLVAGSDWIEFTTDDAIPDGRYRAEVAGFWNGSAIEDAVVRPISGHTVHLKGAISRVKDLKSLSNSQAEKHLPVALRALVTHYDKTWGVLFVQEDGAAVFVNAHGLKFDLKPGAVVDVQGVTGRGGFAPIIVRPRITFAARGPLPKPVKITWPEPNLDKLDSRWCTVEGVIHAARNAGDHTFLKLGFDDSDIVLQVPMEIAGERLIDERVAVTGVFAVSLNDRKQVIGYRVLVQSPKFITVLQRPAAGGALQTIDSLRRYQPGRDEQYAVKLQGIVTVKHQPDVMFIQDGTGGIEVRGSGPLGVSNGDIVSVSGFVAAGEYSPILEDARVLGTSPGVLPNPKRVTVKDALTGLSDSEFVQLSAVVQGIQRGNGAATLDLVSGGTRFSAIGPDAPKIASLRPGSIVSVYGICKVMPDRSAMPPAIRGFSVIFDSPQSVTLIKAAPWWNTRRILWALLMMVAVALLGLIWVAVLRRKVAGRTKELRGSLDAQRKLQSLEAARNSVLETIAANQPLRTSLERLATVVEEQLEHAACMIVVPRSHSSESPNPEDAAPLVIAPKLTEAATSAVLKVLRERSAGATGPSDSSRLEQVRRDVLNAVDSERKRFVDARIAWVLKGPPEFVGALVVFFERRHGQPARPDDLVLESVARLISITYEHWDMQERLMHEAQHDPLTGLPNRALAEDRLDHALARAERAKQSFAVLCMDLDGFKDVNDKFGHLAGDELLRMAADRFQARMRKSDTIGRVGGDEFVAIIEDCGAPADAFRTAENLAATLQEPFVIEEAKVAVTASIGITMYPRDGDTPSLLKRHADQAMYTAKATGGNGIFFWADHALGRSSAEVEDLLRRALQENLFELRYQPIFRADGTPSSVEALLRLHGQHGLLSPSDFIEVAERSGLIIPIGKWVLEEACRRILDWMRQGISVRIAVNASARQFASPNFVEVAAEVLAAYGVDPAMLELELTESLVMSDVRESALRMTRLKELGIHIAVDDFGTGYSSLNYLHTLPIDILKIDRSFTLGIADPGGSRTIVDAIVKMAHTLGMVTVLEGIETPEQLRAAGEAGCDRIQGYLLAKPATANEVADLLRNAGPEAMSAANAASQSRDVRIA